VENLDKFLELLIKIVQDDTLRWEEKKVRILTKVEEDNEDLGIALDEFLSWFEIDDE